MTLRKNRADMHGRQHARTGQAVMRSMAVGRMAMAKLAKELDQLGVHEPLPLDWARKYSALASPLASLERVRLQVNQFNAENKRQLSDRELDDEIERAIADYHHSLPVEQLEKLLAEKKAAVRASREAEDLQ